MQGALFGLFAAIIYIFIAPYIFTYVLPQYIEGIVYSQILAFSFVFALPNRYISLLFESQKMTRVNFINGIASSVCMIILYITLGVYMGLMGLVISGVLYPFLSLIINIVSWEIHHRVLE